MVIDLVDHHVHFGVFNRRFRNIPNHGHIDFFNIFNTALTANPFYILFGGRFGFFPLFDHQTTAFLNDFTTTYQAALDEPHGPIFIPKITAPIFNLDFGYSVTLFFTVSSFSLLNSG